jgi:hypothetical protein
VFTYASVGGVNPGDTIQYYVAAQDNIGNVTTNPSGGAAGFTANPPAAATPPAPPSSYMISAQISGTKTVCSSGCDYASLTGTGGAFDVFNNGVFTGNTVLEIQSNLTVNETGAVALNAFTEEPPASNYTLKIYPAGGPRAIASTTAPTGGFIRLNGADRVTIDGSLNGGGTDRSLTVSTTATGTSVAVIWLQSNGADGATGNVVKNLVVAGNSATTTLFAMGSGSSAVGLASNGSGNHNNVYQNNLILNVQHGIYSGGASAVAKNTGTVIQDNVIDGTAPNNVGTGGIFVRFEDGVQILRNTVSNVLKHDGTTGTSGTAFGIALGVIPSNTLTFTGSDVTNALVSRNKIDALTQLNSTGFSAMGIIVNSVTSGTTTVVNNVISRVRASSTPNDFGIGILAGGGTGSTTRIYFNSVSMTGSRNAATNPSYALLVNTGDPSVDVRDNVLYNTQTSTSTGKSYAVASGGTTFVNLVSDYNDLFVSGTGTFIGQTGGIGTGGTDRATVAAWRTATGRDTNSLADGTATNGLDPLFNSTSNLQPQVGSPVLDAGTPVSIVPYEDFTGATRVDPPTIGAYETGADSVAPVITYTPLGNTSSVANRILSMTATDASGVPTAGVGLPVIYFRKGNAGAYASSQCVSTGGSGYDCVVNYSLVTGGSVAPGDTIQYYVAAQDNNGATTTNPSGGASGFTPNPPAAAVPPSPPNAYLISVVISGSLNVGTGETITSLTNAGGLFEFINNNLLGASTTINLTSDLTAETGAVALNQISEQGAGGYTLTIQSSAAVVRTISGTAASGLIRLNGADRVTFEGRVAGSGQFLRVRNISTSGPAFLLTNDATSNTIESCIVEGANTSTTSGTIVFSTSTGTLGNSSNTIHASDIRDRSDATGVPANAVYSSGSVGAPNGANTVSGCNVFNYTNAGVLVASTGAGDGWTVNPSHFYQTGSRTLPAVGISIMGGSGHNVNSNSIGGSAPGAGGAFWATSSTFRGIDLAVGSGAATSVQGNVIKNIRSTFAAADFASSYGIFIESGRVNLGTSIGNTVGRPTPPSAWSSTATATASAWPAPPWPTSRTTP